VIGRLPEAVTVTDITLRDGLQSLQAVLPTNDKMAIYAAILDSGFRSIEVTSFMRPDRVPQLADAAELLAAIKRRDGVELRALVANPRGVERAAAAGVGVCSVLVTLSDEYCRRNQGIDSAGNLRLATEVVRMARAGGIEVDVSWSMPFFCPYEGPIAPERLARSAQVLLEAGVDAFTLCTSTGLENPREVIERVELLRELSPLPVALHLHDTNGMAMAVALAGLAAGVTRFETAMGGIGGGIALPSGMPGHGNLPTEDLVHMLDELGIRTDLDTATVAAASRAVGHILGREPTSRAATGATKRAVLEMTRH
jgi:hydroxymethylglutaryl-CoA lyase